MEDCRRVSDHDPLQALYEQEPLTNRAEDTKAVCKGLPQEPIITPSIHCEQLPGSTDHLQALLGGLVVTMSLDPSQRDEEEEFLAVSGPLLHAQDTEHLAKLDSAFPFDPSPSLATPSTPVSYSAHTTPLYSTEGGAQSPASSNSDNSLADHQSAADEFKDLHLRPFDFSFWPRLLYHR